MIILLLMAIITNDVIDSKLFTSFGIITGVLYQNTYQLNKNKQ